MCGAQVGYRSRTAAPRTASPSAGIRLIASRAVRVGVEALLAPALPQLRRTGQLRQRGCVDLRRFDEGTPRNRRMLLLLLVVADVTEDVLALGTIALVGTAGECCCGGCSDMPCN
jgi:hypothetical protein